MTASAGRAGSAPPAGSSGGANATYRGRLSRGWPARERRMASDVNDRCRAGPHAGIGRDRRPAVTSDDGRAHRLESTTFTPFARLALAHAIGVCGDVFVTVSLADSIFFGATTSAARGKVLLYLVLTMAPFAVVAPVLGPLLDRTRGGRRLLIARRRGRPGGALPADGRRDRRARCSIRSRSRCSCCRRASRSPRARSCPRSSTTRTSWCSRTRGWR